MFRLALISALRLERDNLRTYREIKGEAVEQLRHQRERRRDGWQQVGIVWGYGAVFLVLH